GARHRSVDVTGDVCNNFDAKSRIRHVFARKEQWRFWIPESSGEEDVRDFGKVLEMRVVALRMFVEFVAVKGTAFPPVMIVSAAQLYIHRFVELLSEEILRAHLAY